MGSIDEEKRMTQKKRFFSYLDNEIHLCLVDMNNNHHNDIFHLCTIDLD